ncbi:MAG: HAD family phosphatase [Dehalococcoidia bacterium]|nr:HAD family phosphatase [Dehalococcoidia bacterium]
MIKAVIFDMDGVLSDSEPLFRESINKILVEEGAQISEQEYKQLIGSTFEHAWQVLIERFNLKKPASHYMQIYDGVVEDTLGAKARPASGVYELMAELDKRKLPKGLASASKRIWINALLRAIKLENSFNVIVAGDEVKKGKPEPEIYITAAHKLGFEPKECVVIEDSPTGILSASRSGAKVVAVRTPYTAGLDISKANVIIDSLANFDYRVLD